MKWMMGRGGFWPDTQQEISEGEFGKVREARDGVDALLRIEDCFEMLVDSFGEYERDRLGLAVEFSLRMIPSQDSVHQTRMLFTRRLMSYLAIARSYRDQTEKTLKSLGPIGGVAAQSIKDLRETYRKTSVEFLFVEECRNWIQHHVLSVNYPRYVARWDDDSGRSLHFGFHTFLRLDEITQSVGFDPEALAKAASLWPKREVVVEGVLRQHLQCWAEIHQQMRAETDVMLTELETAFETIRNRHLEKTGSSDDVLVFGALNEEGDALDRFELVFSQLDRLRARRSQRLPTHISRAYSSSKAE